MIVATAGHVDHGKTTLVAALSGVDTDRLPEEKARGLSIDLGFAYQPLDNGEVLGFVDVPGHEKFIRNMAAGVGGIDLGLLVVAADDGVMPQTREHSAILDIMGVDECMVAITKTDRVDDARIKKVEHEVDNLLGLNQLSSRGTFAVCAPEGKGISELSKALEVRAMQGQHRSPDGYFRLAIDRCFNLSGIGLVVTGMVFSGSAAVGDQLVISPAGLQARVRGIHAMNSPADFAVAGQRCALNLSGRGLSKDKVVRGSWLLEAPLHRPSDRIDVDVRVLASETRALKHWTPVHVHMGAAHATARVALLQSTRLETGSSGRAQLVFETPQCAVHGDRLVLRDQSALRTIAGGRIIDPYSPKRGRKRPERLAWLDAMAEIDHGRALTGVANLGLNGVEHELFSRIRNLGDERTADMATAQGLVDAGRGPVRRWFSQHALQQLRDMLCEALDAWHRANPGELGVNLQQLRMALPERLPIAAVESVVDDLVVAGKVLRRGSLLQDPHHRVVLDPDDEQRWDNVSSVLATADSTPMSLHQAAECLEMTPKELEWLAQKACKAGLAYRVSRNRYVPAPLLHSLADQLTRLGEESLDGLFTAAQFRDISGLGRNFTIDLLEFFDRKGLTERLADLRRIRRQPSEVFGG